MPESLQHAYIATGIYLIVTEKVQRQVFWFFFTSLIPYMTTSKFLNMPMYLFKKEKVHNQQ